MPTREQMIQSNRPENQAVYIRGCVGLLRATDASASELYQNVAFLEIARRLQLLYTAQKTDACLKNDYEESVVLLASVGISVAIDSLQA